MQTFLPYPNFAASARVLDNRRLGKQRVECVQILKAIQPGYATGWAFPMMGTLDRGGLGEPQEGLTLYPRQLLAVGQWYAAYGVVGRCGYCCSRSACHASFINVPTGWEKKIVKVEVGGALWWGVDVTERIVVAERIRVVGEC